MPHQRDTCGLMAPAQAWRGLSLCFVLAPATCLAKVKVCMDSEITEMYQAVSQVHAVTFRQSPRHLIGTGTSPLMHNQTST